MDDDVTRPSPPDENQGPMLMATVLPLFGIALIVYAARIWSRLSPKFALTAADYTVTVAMVRLLSFPYLPHLRPGMAHLQPAG